ncbi:MFS transporter [Pseudarthrobacter sp. P1]|uniref:MFS transporter n=1 Tax=Pseudarthrobacter sp. P1 TaxID=3418418 RepID=UPI003CF2EB3C
MKLRDHPAFVRFWLASTVSDFGTYITGLALSVLILVSMRGSPLDQGLVNAARWAPYLLFGLLAGIWIDGFPRRTVLIAGDFGRGLILAALCTLAILGLATVPVLMVMMFIFGTLALTRDAAYQSFLPQLVPRTLLTRANARLQQSDTVAQTTGSAVAGGLVALLTAALALLIDALSYVLSGIVLLTVRQPPAGQAPTPNGLRMHQRVAEGLRWVYGHAQPGPLAWSSHIWFIGSAILGAVVPALILRELRLGALGLGFILGCAGVGAVIGTSVSTHLGSRWGTGRAMVASRVRRPWPSPCWPCRRPMAVHPTAAIPGSPAVWPADPWAAFVLAAAGQFLFGLAMGVEGPLEMGYRQAVTPDRLIARMSATMRSVNRGMIVIGAPLGGLVASAVGIGTALWTAVAFLLLAALVLLLSTSALPGSKTSNSRTPTRSLPDPGPAP